MDTFGLASYPGGVVNQTVPITLADTTMNGWMGKNFDSSLQPMLEASRLIKAQAVSANSMMVKDEKLLMKTAMTPKRSFVSLYVLVSILYSFHFQFDVSSNFFFLPSNKCLALSAMDTTVSWV